MWIYCLFCETTKCASVAAVMETIYHCRAIRPRQVHHMVSRNHEIRDVMRDFLPGYVFLYFEENPFPQIIRAGKTPGVIRLLGDAENLHALTGEDKEFAEMLLERDGIFGKTRVYEEDGMLHLFPSDFQNVKAKILKVQRSKQRMKIQLQLMDQQPTTWVEYEIAERHGA